MASNGAARPSAGSSARASTKGDRVQNPQLGNVRTNFIDEAIQDPSSVKLCGLYEKSGSSASSKVKTQTMLTSCVKVNQIPDTLYVYSLTFRRPNPKGTAIV